MPIDPALLATSIEALGDLAPPNRTCQHPCSGP